MILFILIMLITGGLALLTQTYVKSMFHRYHQVESSTGYRGAEVAAEILRRNGITDVSIHEHQGFLGDHYDPLHKRLVLSPDVYHGSSLSALGVAAHEAGHALQHQQAYLPLHIRMLAVGVTNFASQLVTWIPILGMAGQVISTQLGLILMSVGWGIIVLFNLVTLPVEYDASARAKQMLARLGFVRTQEEAAGVSAVLNAAALTYLAAFISSLLWALYHILPLLLRNQRSRDE